jgi:alanine-glyoxylate transaminase/serine-glyoxylate transaminase/serine-pyruvate transaminase
MHRSSPNIYEGELVDMMPPMLADLRTVARTDQNVAIYIAHGHGAWEAALANMAGPGDTVLVAATGQFAHGWAAMAETLGIKAEIIEFGTQSPIDPMRISDALRADTARQIKAVLVTHVDTSTSIKNDIKATRDAIDAADHPALLAVDCIASLGCDRFEMDAWGVDVMVAASQKGLMVPPGLAFVYFNEKAAEQQYALERVSSYWNWKPRMNPEVFYQYFCGTAPTLHLYGLRTALDMIKAEGIDAIWSRHKVLAQSIWAAVECWGSGAGKMRMNVQNPQHRSHAVTALHLGAPDGKNLRRWVEHEAGLTLGIGLGMSTPEDPNGDGFFRFGHMGHVNAQMIMGLLGTVEAGLCALDIPHGSGAVEAAALVMASAS